jgi:hypothetical protein
MIFKKPQKPHIENLSFSLSLSDGRENAGLFAMQYLIKARLHNAPSRTVTHEIYQMQKFG